MTRTAMLILKHFPHFAKIYSIKRTVQRIALWLLLSSFRLLTPHLTVSHHKLLRERELLCEEQNLESRKNLVHGSRSEWIDPIQKELIPHTTAINTDESLISLYFRVPSTAIGKNHSMPTILLITELSGYRPDNTQRIYEFFKKGWGCVIVESPKMTDCPADSSNSQSLNRLWDSTMDWMNKKRGFGMKNIVAWNLSTGEYYAVRITHKHQNQVKGSVTQEAEVHRCFDWTWLEKADDHECSFE